MSKLTRALALHELRLAEERVSAAMYTTSDDLDLRYRISVPWHELMFIIEELEALIARDE